MRILLQDYSEKMSVLNPTGLVYDRIGKFSPEYVAKIMGQASAEQEMSRLALSPESLIQEMFSTGKIDFKQSSPEIPSHNHSYFSHGHIPSHYQQFFAKQQADFAAKVAFLEHQNQSPTQNQFSPFDDHVERLGMGGIEIPMEYFYPKEFDRNLNGRVFNRRQGNSVSEFPTTKTCHYFNRGYCKHGNNCRYLHSQARQEGFSPMPFLNDGPHDDQIYLPGSLEKLELEIVELLKSRRGNPLSIASLPMLYYERYKKVLQAEGYLTESQRHGKAGHSLTRLLSRLDSIRLIDRPHGQHAVILAEDASKYLEGQNEGTLINSKSRQIYLTFPAESTFSEEDVSNYFSCSYGPVEDVRIPCQHKRMFGFVTFVDPETVQMILSKGNPHYVCGARVLVKPYKEKSKIIDRKYYERNDYQLHHNHMQPYVDAADSQYHSVPRGYKTSRLLRYIEDRQRAIEYERNLQLARKRLQEQQQLYILNSLNSLKISEDHNNVPSVKNFDYLVDDNKLGFKENANPDQDSDALNFPDSPFASSIIKSITNLIS